MNVALTSLPLLLGGGVACGLLNTLASSGSAITLPLLLWLGFDPGIANATNRLPVVVGSLGAVATFHRKQLIDWAQFRRLAPALLLGTIAGAAAARMLPASDLRLVIVAALLAALVILVCGLGRLLEPPAPAPTPARAWVQLIFGAIGFWLGFLVLDGATYLLLGLVLVGRCPLVKANALKASLLGLSALVSVLLLARGGAVAWGAGSLLALGSLAGGWLGALLAARPEAKVWIVRTLIAVVGFECLNLLRGLVALPFVG